MVKTLISTNTQNISGCSGSHRICLHWIVKIIGLKVLLSPVPAILSNNIIESNHQIITSSQELLKTTTLTTRLLQNPTPILIRN